MKDKVFSRYYAYNALRIPAIPDSTLYCLIKKLVQAAAIAATIVVFNELSYAKAKLNSLTFEGLCSAEWVSEEKWGWSINFYSDKRFVMKYSGPELWEIRGSFRMTKKEILLTVLETDSWGVNLALPKSCRLVKTSKSILYERYLAAEPGGYVFWEKASKLKPGLIRSFQNFYVQTENTFGVLEDSAVLRDRPDKSAKAIWPLYCVDENGCKPEVKLRKGSVVMVYARTKPDGKPVWCYVSIDDLPGTRGWVLADAIKFSQK
jgi:hypothetical protein